MQVYLPIAEMSLNLFLLLGAGGIVGFLSGMFGVGGGFLVTPLLMLAGVPPVIAVASQSSQTVASSVSGTLVHWRKQNIDVKLALFLTSGSLVGVLIGMWIFKQFAKYGQIDIVITLCYIALLGSVGGLMLIESVLSLFRRQDPRPVLSRKTIFTRWINGLPLSIYFPQAHIRTSVFPILIIGACIGILTAVMGIGGGFIMVPAMIYILGIPTRICVGTSLLQVLIVTAFSTCAHAILNQSVDVLLALVLMIGSVTSAQFGARIGLKLRGDHLRILFALLVLGTGLYLAFRSIVTPIEPFSLTLEKTKP